MRIEITKLFLPNLLVPAILLAFLLLDTQAATRWKVTPL